MNDDLANMHLVMFLGLMKKELFCLHHDHEGQKRLMQKYYYKKVNSRTWKFFIILTKSIKNECEPEFRMDF